MPKIVIPYKPRAAFLPLHNNTKRWALIVAHRRAGKTVACVNHLIRAAITAILPYSQYAYIAPFYKQAKKVAWRYLKHFSSVIEGVIVNESELYIELPNKARVTLYGADKADSLRGQYWDGVVADEYGDWKPSVWGYVIRPALADRKGWAIIIGTSKGRNGFWQAKCHAEANDDWLCMTIKADESGILDAQEMADLRLELTEDAWRQEMECDFDAALPGAIFGKELWQADQEGRIRSGAYDPDLPVHAAMDIGFSDDTAIIWFQVKDGMRIIDCYSTHGQGVEHYHHILKHKPYNYAHWLWLPHDARAKTMASPRSVQQQFEGLGWHTRIIPELSLVDGIQAARSTLKDCIIDTKCQEGIEAWKQYQREYDEDKKCFRDKPRHDWTSHYSDALRYVSLVWREEIKIKDPDKPKYPQDRTINEIIRNNASRQRQLLEGD